MKYLGQGELTYGQRGLTQFLGTGSASLSGSDGWPEGYRRVQRRIRVGSGPEGYAQLAAGILSWGIQRGAGLTVHGAPAVEPGGRVLCGFGVGPLRLPVPCEVVWVRQPTAAVVLPDGRLRPQRAGFGYGTLPGHPATGEEAFIASLGSDGGVHFELLAFSKPAGLMYRIASPVTTLAQRLVTHRYLQAARNLTG